MNFQFSIINYQLSIFNYQFSTLKNSPPKGLRFFLFRFPPFHDAFFHVPVSFFRREPSVALFNEQFVVIQQPFGMIDYFGVFIVFGIHWF
jgi:hypothetical protein